MTGIPTEVVVLPGAGKKTWHGEREGWFIPATDRGGYEEVDLCTGDLQYEGRFFSHMALSG